jgi:hypothetical protein
LYRSRFEVESPRKTIHKHGGRDAIKAAVIKCLPKIARLERISAWKKLTVQELEYRSSLGMGGAADVGRSAQRFHEGIEPAAIAAEFLVAVNSAGDQSSLQ